MTKAEDKMAADAKAAAEEAATKAAADSHAKQLDDAKAEYEVVATRFRNGGCTRAELDESWAKAKALKPKEPPKE